MLRQILYRDAFLLHGIALAQRDGVAQVWSLFAKRFKIDRNAEGGADFILTTVTPADCAGLIIKNEHAGPEEIDDYFRLRHQRFFVFQKWKNGAFHWRHSRMESEDRPRLHFSLFIGRLVLGVGLANQRKHSAIHPGARLDHVRNKLLFRFFVEIFERLTAGFLVLGQIVIGPISDAFEFLAPKRKVIFDVVSAFGIKRALFVRHGQNMEMITWYPDVFVKLQKIGRASR